METRASYIAVGAFVLFVAVGLVGFVAWLGADSAAEIEDQYVINFTGTVTGLQNGSTVRFRGIPVGSVSDIRINPANVEQVQVTVSIDAATPVSDEDVASLEIQGITGGVYILIGGGSQGASMLSRAPGAPPPEIPAIASSLQAVVQSAPELLDEAGELLQRANLLLSDENIASVSQTLTDVEAITGRLVDGSNGLVSLIEQVNRTSEDIDALAVDFQGMVAEFRVDMARFSDGTSAILSRADQQLLAVGGELQTAVAGFRGVATQLNSLLVQIRPGIVEFAGNGLYEFTLMVSELRGLATSLTRVADRIERDPAQFLFGDQTQGIQLE